MIETSWYINTMQTATLVVFALALMIEIICTKKEKRNKYWGIPILAYSSHVMIYYIIVHLLRLFLKENIFSDIHIDVILTSWSTVLRFHSGITILLFTINKAFKIGKLPLVDNTIPVTKYYFKVKSYLVKRWITSIFGKNHGKKT